MKKKLRIVIYYRISKKVKNNIRMQRKICRNYCKEKGFRIIKEYYDKGFSGRTKNRPELKKMLNRLSSGRFDSVLVYKVDRLGRNFNYLNHLINEMEKKNIGFISATQKFDSMTPEGKFLLRFLTLLSEFESGIISQRTIHGLKAKRKMRK
jgi:site-specific DNA recombinase